MIKRIRTFIFFLVIAFMSFTPFFANAAQANAGKTGITYECVGPTGKAGECDFNDLIAATKKLVNWGIEISIALSVIVIAYAGYLYMTSGGNTGQLAKANGMLWKVVQGIAIMMAAWLIVQLIASVLITNPNVPSIIQN